MLMQFWQGRESLKSLSKLKTAHKSIFADIITPEKKSMVFNEQWLKLGWSKNYNELWTIQWNMSEVFRAVILGKTRSGKTWFTRRVGTVAFNSGYSVIYLTDIKNEMKTSKQPLQDKFKKFLAEGEYPISCPTVTLRPKFMDNMLGASILDDEQYFQLSLGDISSPDLLLLLNFTTDKSKNQIQIVTNIWAKVISGEIKNLQEFHDAVGKDPAQKALKQSILNALQPLIAYEVVGEQLLINWATQLNNNIVTINLEGYDQVSAHYMQAYVRIIMRIIYNLRKKGLLKKRVIIFIDEAGRFLREDSISGQEIRRQVDESAYLGIFMLISAQPLNQIPKAVTAQARYILLPRSYEFDEMFKVLRFAQIYRGNRADKQDFSEQLTTLHDTKDGQKMWLMLDTAEHKLIKIYPFAPLSWHDESKK